MQKNHDRSILDRLMSFEGLFTRIFGKYSDAVVYDQEREHAKRILYEVYGYKDIYDLLPPVLDEVKVMDYARTLMQIDIMQSPENTSIGIKNNPIE